MRFQRKKPGKAQSGLLGETASRKHTPETRFNYFQAEKTSIRAIPQPSKDNEILHDLSNLSHSFGLKLFLLEKSMRSSLTTAEQKESLEKIKTAYEGLLMAVHELKRGDDLNVF